VKIYLGSKEESFVNNMDCKFRTKLSMTKYPNETVLRIRLECCSKPFMTMMTLGLNKSGYFEDDLKLVLADITTPKPK
jgi:hypothetical protein